MINQSILSTFLDLLPFLALTSILLSGYDLNMFLVHALKFVLAVDDDLAEQSMIIHVL